LNGKVIIKNLEYPEDFPAGKYTLIISDVTKEKLGEVQSEKIDILIVQSDK